jgi:hypothetical protein
MFSHDPLNSFSDVSFPLAAFDHKTDIQIFID